MRKADTEAITLRVQGLEGRMASVEKDLADNTRELRANTELTRQVHEMMDGRDDEPGMIDKVDSMHEAFALARGGFRALEFLGKAAKPLLFIGALCAAVYGFWKTGHWSFIP